MLTSIFPLPFFLLRRPAVWPQPLFALMLPPSQPLRKSVLSLSNESQDLLLEVTFKRLDESLVSVGWSNFYRILYGFLLTV
jgi:hypothetical protein